MTKRVLLAALFLTFAGGARAATTTLTLQRGLDGYDGVADTFLYAPSSVANINYGAYRSLNAGINRWREHYVALIRFDLSGLPPAARVARASLWLWDASKSWPARDLTVDIQAVAPANADWSEGRGDGTRVPVKGAPCWNFRRYNTARWAGAAGLRKTGVDTVEPPLGSALVKKGHEGWVEFPLRADAVQRWLKEPAANAGVRVFPLAAKQKGDVFGCHSSDGEDHPSRRPKLALEIEMSDADARTLRRAHATRAVKSLEALFEEVRAAVARAGNPPRVLAALRDAQNRLASARDSVQTRDFATDDSLAPFAASMRKLRGELRQVPHTLTLAQGAAANERRGLATDFALGVADSMTNVLRAPGLFKGQFAETAEIEMARNEFEAAQIVIVPIDKDLAEATWSASALQGPGGATIPAQDVSVAVMGYLKSRKPALPSTVEWWPAPILDFMKAVDVKRGEVQPLWVCVRTRQDTPAGLYRGAITVKAAEAKPKSVGLRVRVFDFAVPVEQHLLTVWGNNEPTYRTLYGDRYGKKMARAMFDFFIEHRLALNSLYSAQSAGKPIADGWFSRCIGYPTLSDPQELKRLWDAGSRWWNLGYLHPVFAKNAGMSLEAYVPKFIDMMRESLKVADAAGWPHANLGIYLFDETRNFKMLNKAAAQVKAAFPDIPLMTTAYDRSYGVKNGPIDKSIDIWCPLTPRFAQDLPAILQGRKLGKRAWWYVCCGPRGRKPLNFFSQYPAIRPRLLMGAATWKYRPDGFLYYRVSGWRHYKKPIDSGPLTAWVPYYLPGPDGDGELICPGPNGPLSTLQFENIRDGIEDFEYLWLLRDRVEKARQRGLAVAAEEALLTVPKGLLASLTSYSEDPARLRAARRKIAEAIVRLDARLKPPRP